MPGRSQHVIPGAPQLAAVFAGGVVGALARVALAETAAQRPASWPWETFAVNLAGALLLGWALVALSGGRDGRTRLAPPFVGAGLCGALTTFSTFQLELLRMLDEGALGLALAYGGASVVLGLAAVAAGERLGRRSAA